MDELASWVLATGNRNRFFPHLLRCFRAQTYPHRELVIVDDGRNPVGRLCRGVDNVRYIRLRCPTSTGAKLNLAIQHAAGSIIQKVDDDDYYGPELLATAVKRLLASRSKRAILAWDRFLIRIAGDPVLRFSGHGWLAGGTLCFRRAVWESAPFRDVKVDEDKFFLEDHPGPRIRVREPEQYVLVRHGRNTWRRFSGGARVDGYFGSLPAWPTPLGEIVDPEAARFYATLKR